MYPPQAVQALRDALKSVYYYKDDLRQFFLASEVPTSIVSKQAWDDPREYKVHIVRKVLDELLALREEGVGPMRRLIQGALSFPNFDHLRKLDDGPRLVQEARQAVEALRQVVEKHDSSLLESKAERRDASIRVAGVTNRRHEETEALYERFCELVAVPDEQDRGRQFEHFLRDLFLAHDLKPRSPFRLHTEQIDGAFELDGTYFIVEAKWEKERVGHRPLDSFAREVERRLDNTLGLFVALSGFTEEGLETVRKSRPTIILFDGQDLAIVLQGLEDFVELLRRKIRHAAQTGDPYLRAGAAP
jgi:hypothetical protein